MQAEKTSGYRLASHLHANAVNQSVVMVSYLVSYRALQEFKMEKVRLILFVTFVGYSVVVAHAPQPSMPALLRSGTKQQASLSAGDPFVALSAVTIVDEIQIMISSNCQDLLRHLALASSHWLFISSLSR